MHSQSPRLLVSYIVLLLALKFDYDTAKREKIGVLVLTVVKDERLGDVAVVQRDHLQLRKPFLSNVSLLWQQLQQLPQHRFDVDPSLLRFELRRSAASNTIHSLPAARFISSNISIDVTGATNMVSQSIH